MIECGHPRISADERERVRAVVAAVSTPVLAHARARREDIDAVLETGAQWVGLFASINAISLETKFKGMNREEVLELFHDAIHMLANAACGSGPRWKTPRAPRSATWSA